MKKFASIAVACTVLALAPAANAQSNGAGSSGGGERDGFRLRGGIGIGGGPLIPFGLGTAASTGGMGAVSVRLGVQFMHAFGVYVQSMNSLGAIGFVTNSGNVAGYAMAQSQNALLASLTFAHLIEIAAGPSLDYIAFFGCDASMSACSSGEGAGLGGHLRGSLNLGGPIGGGPRRMAFNVGLDLHPTFFLAQRGGFFSAALTIGVEWY